MAVDIKNFFALLFLMRKLESWPLLKISYNYITDLEHSEFLTSILKDP